MKAETKLVVDASPVGLGCVLLQNVDGRWQPLSYGSRSLTATEKRYSQIEREAMAVLFGLQKMHTYIYGRHVVVSTDHKPLLGVFNKNTQSIRLERIALRCQDYDFTLTYEPGSVNIADGLSRLPLNTTGTGTSFVEEHVRFVKSADALLSIDESIDQPLRRDTPFLQQLHFPITSGRSVPSTWLVHFLERSTS